MSRLHMYTYYFLELDMTGQVDCIAIILFFGVGVVPPSQTLPTRPYPRRYQTEETPFLPLL